MKAKNPVKKLYEEIKTDSPAKVKLVSYLKRREPNLTDKEASELLQGIKRFVNLTHKIYTEPQANIVYKDKKRIFNTTFEELMKVKEGQGQETITDIMGKFLKSASKTKYD